MWHDPKVCNIIEKDLGDSDIRIEYLLNDTNNIVGLR